MIQRIQSIYLLVAVVLSVISIFLFWGLWIPVALLAISSLISGYAIFAYGNRMFQAKLCMFNILLLIGWLIVYFVLMHVSEEGLSSVGFSALLPCLSIVFNFLARRAIIADERLVRAADRIR